LEKIRSTRQLCDVNLVACNAVNTRRDCCNHHL